MSVTLERLYVDFLRSRYQGASRRMRSMILDRLCRDAHYGFDSKWVRNELPDFQQLLEIRPHRTGRGKAKSML